MKATLGYGASTCSYTDWLDADLDRPLRIERREQPAGGDEVSARRQETRRPDRRRESLSRARPVAVLGAVDCQERALRYAARRSLVRRAHRRRPRVPRRRSARARRNRRRRRGIRARAHDWGSTRRARRRLDVDWDGPRARERCRPRQRCATFARLLVERPERGVHLVDGPDAARARRRDDQGARQRRPGARACRAGPDRGLVPIRGHSGVQGGAEVGCVPAVDAATAARWSRGLGVSGLGRARLDRCRDGRASRPPAMWTCSGWSAAIFSRRCPTRTDPGGRLRVRGLRIHHDIVLSSSMLAESDGDVLILPAATRYESEGGGTETSTERRIIFSPEIPGRRDRHRRSPSGGCLARPWRASGRIAQTTSASTAQRRFATRSRARFRSTRASRRSARRAIRCSGAAERSTPTGGSRPTTARRASRRSRLLGLRASPAFN